MPIIFPIEKRQDDMGVQCSLRSFRASRARPAGPLARGARRFLRVCALGGGGRRCCARSVLPLLEKIMIICLKIYIKHNDSMLEKNIISYFGKFIDCRQPERPI